MASSDDEPLPFVFQTSGKGTARAVLRRPSPIELEGRTRGQLTRTERKRLAKLLKGNRDG